MMNRIEIKHVLRGLLTVLICSLILGGCASNSGRSNEADRESWKSPTLEETAAALDGLPFDAFAETAFEHVLLIDPTGIAILELADELGVRYDRWTDYSPEAWRTRLQAYELIRERLVAFDLSQLSDQQRLVRDVFLSMLDGLANDIFPTFSAARRSPHLALVRYLEELHPLETPEDVEDYLARMESLDNAIEQLIAFEEDRVASGWITSGYVLGELERSVHAAIPDKGEPHVLVVRLEDELGDIEGMSEEEREDALERAEKLVDRKIRPAFEHLYDTVEQWRLSAPHTTGISACPGGEEAYRQAIARMTSLTPEEIHELALADIEMATDVLMEMGAEYGLPDDMSPAEVMARLTLRTARWPVEQGLEKYRQLVRKAEDRCEGLFWSLPESTVTVQLHPRSLFEQPVAASYHPDGFGTQTASSFVIYHPRGMAEIEVDRNLMYHEVYPGHHLQMALEEELDAESDSTLLRNYWTKGYAEGWATYAETLAWEQGWFDDDRKEQADFFLGIHLYAAYAVVDTGIHALGWTRAQSETYLTRVLGVRASYTSPFMDSVMGPADRIAYWIGRHTFLSLRDRARKALEERFDIRDFHQAVLEHGTIPLPVLERIVDEHIESALREGEALDS